MDLSHKQHGSRGQGMVEFAMVFPLLLLLLFGIFEFGRIMFAYSAVVSASREAARYGAAILDTGGGIPQYEDCVGIRNAAKRIGRYAGISDSDISIQYSNSSGVYSTSCPPSQEVAAADTISVTINAAITPVTPVGNFSAIPISSSSSRTILKSLKLGASGTGAGSISGALTDVNFKTTYQTVEETQGTIGVVLELNSPATDIVTVPFSVTGTAVQGAGGDYLITTSPVTINPGETTATIYITLNNDGVDEGDESLVIGIDSPINATRGPQYIHTIKIVDPPLISFKEVNSTYNENSPLKTLMVELSKGSTQDVTVSFTRTGTAVWGVSGDYVTTPGTLTIPSGSLFGALSLQIIDDNYDEEDEVAVITLDSPVNAVIGANPSHTLTILDNDDPPQVSFFAANQIVSEEIGKFVTSLTLSEISGKEIVVPYTLSGTTTSGDYTIQDPSPLIIPPGSSSVDIAMDIMEGDGWEEDETLIITLGAPQNATLGSIAEQTIVITESSAEPTVSFTVASQTVVEGNLAIDLNVRLSNAWSAPVKVYFSTAGTATEGSSDDYQLSSNYLVIPVGWPQGTITVEIHDDEIDEAVESIVVNIDTIENGGPGSLTSTNVLIQDNDSPPVVSVLTANKSIVEGGGAVEISLGLSAPSVYDVSVPLNLSGSATLNGDYTISTQNVLIPEGTTTGSFQITVVDDAVYDPDENVAVALGSPTNAGLGSPSSFNLVIEDDELPTCQVGTHLLTVGIDAITLSMVNEGEEVEFTGGSISWTAASPNQPRLSTASFAGTQVFSGSEKPPSFSYGAAVPFSSLGTESVAYQFDGPLGTGDHVIVSTFHNLTDGSTCSLTETFTIH